MDNPNMVGKVIKHLLDSSANVGRLAGGRIFPIISPSPDLPCVVYTKTSARPANTKESGSTYDEFTVVVVANAPSYSSMVELSGAISKALDNVCGDVDGLRVKRIRLADSSDGFDDGAFTQTMTFEIRINTN